MPRTTSTTGRRLEAIRPSEAGLRFGSDEEPGIRRRGHARFSYVVERTGRRPSAADMRRIAALAVPPAWTDVWIAGDADSHVQATGRDARGRKQYRYHPQFSASRSENKFAELATFGATLGSLRRRVRYDLHAADLSHDQVVAVVVRLLDVTSLRVGNAEYARSNRSFGLTTLLNRHAIVHGSSIELSFRGKSAHEFEVTVDSSLLARLVRRCQHLPGQQLFRYRTASGEVRTVGSTDVNDYLSQHAYAGATTKTFRTWNATVSAAVGLARAADAEHAPSVRTVGEVVDMVAAELGNTRTVCRTSYVHPAVVAEYLDGVLLPRWNRRPSTRPGGLSVDERRTLRLLRHAEQRSDVA